MSVRIIWSREQGGVSVAEPLNHGDNRDTAITDPITIYLRHDGENEITNCAFYTRPWTTTYLGDFDPTDDFNEITDWGTQTTTSGFGGIQFNLDANGDFPSYNWPDKDNHIAASGVGFVAASGIAVSEGTAFTLPPEMGLTTPGVIPAGSPDVSFQVRFQIPLEEDTPGIRLIQQVLKFTYTA